MPSDRDLLFGKIVVDQGYCTQGQVDQCLKAQALSERPMPLGRHLVDEGALTEEQHSRALEIQRKNMLAPDPVTRRSRQDVLFGKLAVREGFITEPRLNEALRLQALEGETRSLGEVLVSLGFLDADQVKALLSRQQKKIMHCPHCGLSFTVRTLAPEKRVDCPRCRGPLKDGKPSDSTRTDAEIDVRAQAAVAARSPAPGARKVSGLCRVCEAPFEEFPDSTGRLRCPRCLTLFVAK